jgi:hypothetical protein
MHASGITGVLLSIRIIKSVPRLPQKGFPHVTPPLSGQMSDFPRTPVPQLEEVSVCARVLFLTLSSLLFSLGRSSFFSCKGQPTLISINMVSPQVYVNPLIRRKAPPPNKHHRM